MKILLFIMPTVITIMTITLIVLMAIRGASSAEGWKYWFAIGSIDWNIAWLTYQFVKICKL